MWSSKTRSQICMSNRLPIVKVYVMKVDEQWKQICRGQISTKYIERLQGVCLLIHSESDGSLLLEYTIHPDVPYKKQYKHLISWPEGNNSTMTIYFPDPECCQSIWEDICQVQHKDPNVQTSQDLAVNLTSFHELPQFQYLFEEPTSECNMLETIADLLIIVKESPSHKKCLALLLGKLDYIKKLLRVFHTCEDQKNVESLHFLYIIIKGLFFFNDAHLFNTMFSDECIMDVIGCLEYDPNLDKPYRHRKFLAENAKFKEVMPITHSKLRQKIHQTYKMQYIHDILLPIPSKFHENRLSDLTASIFSNKIEIVTMLQEDEMFLLEIFAQLEDKIVGDERRCELLFFLKEFCEFAMTLKVLEKEALLKTVIKLGIMRALKVSICMQDHQIKVAAVDIFTYIVEYNPQIVRVYAVDEAQNSENKDDLLINIMIKQIICDPDPESSRVLSLTAVLRILLDPENMCITANASERSKFMNLFYTHCIDKLAGPILSITGQNDGDDNTVNIYSDIDQNVQLLGVVLEMLSFCVKHHTIYIKNYILKNNLLSRVLVLMHSKHTLLVLSALRLMRQMIGLKDEIYNLYIVRKNLFKPVISSLLRNGRRYNMLNSAIIELFEFIRVENIKSLITNIVENFYMAFDSIEYVQTFKGLRFKYEEQKEQENKVKRNLHDMIYEKLHFKHMKVVEVDVKEEMCPRVNTGAVVALGGDMQSSCDTFMQIKETSEEEVEQSEENSFEFDCSSQSEASDRGMSSPSHCSKRISLVDYSDDEDDNDSDDHQDDEDEKEEPPPKRPNLGS
ncbi:protein PPP4R3C1-like [Microtus pennsylvanicus]|uniref:protein PPP4R3C1-like n=1 Tax=Microtus pennsylvanicus TaxID=10058 RepID=UPI003F6B1E00